MPVEAREHSEVLGPPGGFLGADHIVQVGDGHLDSLDEHPVRVHGQLRVAIVKPAGSEGDVELAVLEISSRVVDEVFGRSVLPDFKLEVHLLRFDVMDGLLAS